MSDDQYKLPVGTFWYAVVFIAGLYWGISFQSGGFGGLFAFLVPPVLCIVTATVVASGSRRRFVLGTITLYVNFLFSFAIGYGMATAGIIHFNYD